MISSSFGSRRWLGFFEIVSLRFDSLQCKRQIHAKAPDWIGQIALPAWHDRSELGSGEIISGSGQISRHRRFDDRNSKSEGEALDLYEKLRRGGGACPVSVTLAALKGCMRDRDLQTGRRIHVELAEGRAELHGHVANSLVEMYAKCGSMAEAREVFDRMKHHSVVSWNAIIMGYALNGDGEEALTLFSRMQVRGFVPDARIFIAALKACTELTVKEEGTQVGERTVKAECLKRGRAIHGQLWKRGYEADLFVASTLVDFYAKCGSMAEAREVFDRMEHYDVVSWTAMILGYAVSGEGELGLEFYSRMQREGFKPDSRIFVAALKACGSVAVRDEGIEWKKSWLEKGMAIHTQIIKAGYEDNIYVAASLVDMYARCGSLENSRRVFGRARQRNVVLWNSIITAFAQNGQEESALEFFKNMKAQGFVPDARTTAVAITACTALAGKEEGKESGEVIVKAMSLERGRSLHLEAVKNSHDSDVFVASALVDFYAKCGSMDDARQVFEEMERHSSAAWQAIISGYAHNGEEETALELFERMKAKGGVTPSARHYIAAVKACGGLAALEAGRKIHKEIREGGYEADVLVTNSLVHFYGKCGSMEMAQQVFDNASSKTLVTWNALIAGYTQQGDTGRAFAIFERLKKETVLPNEITFLHILNACNHAGLVEKGKEVFEAMRSKFPPGLEQYTCMIDLLGRANRLDDALAMVRSMPCKPDPTLWRAVLGACQKWSNTKVGKVAFDSLLELDKGDATAYVLMANIYASSKMWKESTNIQSMTIEL